MRVGAQAARAILGRGIHVRDFAKRVSGTDTQGVITTPVESIRIGDREPTWELAFHEDAEIDRVTQLSIATDYLEGRLTATGNQRHILPLRHHLPFGLTLKGIASSSAEFPRALSPRHRKAVIETHYDRPDEFFLAFLDGDHHLYSQGHFASPTDDLESAAKRKLERIAEEFRRIRAERVLDVGCGWGGVTSFLAPEFEVTALTLGQRSFEFTRHRLAQAQLSANVLLADVLMHESEAPYDGVVILGVLEHIPQYGKLFARLAILMRPGGRIYVDCASSYSRLAMNPFIRRRIWTGTHGFVNLPALLKSAQRHGFTVVELSHETKDYAATMGHWADRFAAQREAIEALTGQADYRAFEMYLFGGEESLLHGNLEAYRCILERQAS